MPLYGTELGVCMTVTATRRAIYTHHRPRVALQLYPLLAARRDASQSRDSCLSSCSCWLQLDAAHVSRELVQRSQRAPVQEIVLARAVCRPQRTHGSVVGGAQWRRSVSNQ